MPLLELRDVHARYGPIRALHGISLTVDEGEVVALLGANGAGKTTTLRSVSSTVRTSGDVLFDGRSIARRRADAIARLGVAHVPEGRGLFSELSVWENPQFAPARGEAFLADLVGTVKPAIDARYRTRPAAASSAVNRTGECAQASSTVSGWR